MERALVLQLLDTAWKDHLLAMDHLRSSVGLRGYAQVDPKVEYKREGMRTFEQMWTSVGERVTDLIFRMEQLDESFVGSTWTEAEAIHEDAPSAGEIAAQQQAAIDGTRSRPQAGADPQPPAARRPQRSLPLRQRQEVQELLHAEGRRAGGLSAGWYPTNNNALASRAFDTVRCASVDCTCEGASRNWPTELSTLPRPKSTSKV